MANTAIAVILLMMVRSVSTAEEAPARLPHSAQDIIVKMDKDLSSVRDKAVAALEKILKEVAKRGDLDGATAIDGKIKELKANPLSIFANDDTIANQLSGVWVYTDGAMVFTATIADGILTNSDGNTATVTMTGMRLTLAWKTGQRYHLDYDGRMFSGKNPQLVTMIRTVTR